MKLELYIAYEDMYVGIAFRVNVVVTKIKKNGVKQGVSDR